MPRKRKHSSEEEDEEAEEVEKTVRTKRRAAVEARDRVAAKEGESEDEEEEEEDFDDEDDEKDEDYEGEAPEDEEGEEEGDDDGDEEDENEAGEGDEEEEDEEGEEEEPESVECILADLEEPTKGMWKIYFTVGILKRNLEEDALSCTAFESNYILKFVITQRGRTRATEHESSKFEVHADFARFDSCHLVLNKLIRKKSPKGGFFSKFSVD